MTDDGPIVHLESRQTPKTERKLRFLEAWCGGEAFIATLWGGTNGHPGKKQLGPQLGRYTAHKF